MEWFRFYSTALDDPKVQRLPGELFKAWVNLLCLANQGEPRGVLPSVEDIAFRLRMPERDAEQVVAELIERELLDVDDDGTLTPHGWSKRQPKSDSSTERVQRHRAKRDDSIKEETVETLPQRSSNALDKTREDKTREEQKHTADASAPRVRDELFEAVAEECYGAGMAYGTFALTSSNRSRINKSLPDLKRVGVTSADVHAFATAYRARSPDFPLKPQTIAENITEYRNKRNGAQHHAESRTSDAEVAAIFAEAGVIGSTGNGRAGPAGGPGNVSELPRRIEPHRRV